MSRDDSISTPQRRRTEATRQQPHPGGESPPVFAIVLNWNCWNDTFECVRTLRQVDYPNCRVIVVDNGSSDDSETRLRALCPEVDFIQTGANLGYAGGNNVGIRHALEQGAAYVLVTNPDVFLDRSSLTLLVAACESNQQLGAVCPVIRWKSRPERVWFGGSRIEWSHARARHEYIEPPPNQLHLSAWASGCCLLLSAEALRSVGLFDEDLFLYWEESDLCERLQIRGYEVAVCSGALALHAVHGSTGPDSPTSWYYFTRNGLYFFRRYASNHGGWTWMPVSRLLFRFMILGTAWAIVSGDGTARARLRGSIDFLRGRTGQAAG